MLLDKFTKQLAGWFNWVAIVGLVLMLTTLVVDVLGSKLFHHPVPGSVDILGLMGLIVGAFALGEAEILGNHIRVDFVTIRLSDRAKNIFGVISSLFTLAMIAIIIFTGTKYSLMLQKVGGGSQTLEIPFYPFTYIMTLTFIPLFLLILIETIQFILKVRKK